jgi:hypothetical protein
VAAALLVWSPEDLGEIQIQAFGEVRSGFKIEVFLKNVQNTSS